MDTKELGTIEQFIVRHGRKFAMGAGALASGTLVAMLGLVVALRVEDHQTVREVVELVVAYLVFATTAAGGFAITNAGVEVAHALKRTPNRTPTGAAHRPSGVMPAEGTDDNP